MFSTRTTGWARAGALVAATAALLALAGGAQASPARHADSICKVAQGSEWKKIDDKVSKAGNVVSAAMGGSGIKEGQAAAKVIADGLRKESKLILKASGNDKAKKSLSGAYVKAAEMYDRVSETLPQLASAFTAAKKGDPKALDKVMGVMTKVLTPAADALGKLSTGWNDLFKNCT
jgi:hypothetical protein